MAPERLAAGAGLHVLITGAAGFIGRALALRLAADGQLGGRPLARVSLADIGWDAPLRSALLHPQAGSVAEPAFVQRLFAKPVDVVWHLASVPGGLAEQQYALARNVNLHGTQLLLEACKAQVDRNPAAAPPTFVFASSIAVFGAPLPARIDDATLPRPQLAYGAHKLIGELLVDDFSRRGWVDGRSPRLPGVLARPAERTGQLSAFLSDIVHVLGSGQPFVCPTAPTATTWASSIGATVDNLLHAATVDGARLGARSFTVPTSCFTMQALVDAIGAERQVPAGALVRWAPDARTEALFGRYPPLDTPLAEAAGFRADADLRTLVRHATG